MTSKARTTDTVTTPEHLAWCAPEYDCAREGYHAGPSVEIEGERSWVDPTPDVGYVRIAQEVGVGHTAFLEVEDIPGAMSPEQALRFAYELQRAAVAAGHPVERGSLDERSRGGWREDGTYWAGNGFVGVQPELVEGMNHVQRAEFCGFVDGYGAGLQSMIEILRPVAGVPTFGGTEV